MKTIHTFDHVSDKSCREYQITHFVFSKSINGALYEIIWKFMAQPDKPQMTTIKGAGALHAA